jgi:hypothetical protein
MIVGDFDVISISILEAEAYPPLLVDPNAVLAAAIPAEGLEPIGPHLHQILDTSGVGQNKELSLRLTRKRSNSLTRSPSQNRLVRLSRITRRTACVEGDLAPAKFPLGSSAPLNPKRAHDILPYAHHRPADLARLR